MIRLLCLLAFVTLTFGYGPEDFIHILGATQFGFWGQTAACANGSYAYAFDIMLENEHGILDDDTSVNAISLHCSTFDGNHTGEVTSSTMDRGRWTGVKACEAGKFLKGYNIKSEASASDQTAANGLKMWCQGSEEALEPPENKWGVWLERANCPGNKVICGLMTNVQDNQGTFGDDSALNDVRFLCCEPSAKQN
ncbi:Vitelline membrane outer layer protein 1 [Halocaridina rubra]|uniref:Vitelline membrane outer layer protein 1 n=1 Tax=Halocaridina rubra TaxID=373956 RepID=A0AAN8X9Y0_HALRR